MDLSVAPTEYLPSNPNDVQISPLKPHRLSERPGHSVSLHRFTVPKYVRQGQLSPFRIYSDFDIYGEMHLDRLPEKCSVSIKLFFKAYEWSPFLLIDGSLVHLESNGKLESEYLDAIVARLSRPERE